MTFEMILKPYQHYWEKKNSTTKKHVSFVTKILLQNTKITSQISLSIKPLLKVML
jgi:hypothetical protein